MNRVQLDRQVLVVLPWLLALACTSAPSAEAPNTATVDAGHKPRVKLRTVSLELWKTAERVLDKAADGSFKYGPLIDLEGVEVCVARQRPAFASFEPFHELPQKLCTTSVAGKYVELSGVPANSDLILTLSKAGYIPSALTFRTDDGDTSAPTLSGSTSTPLLKEDATDPWLEADPRPRPDGGLLAVFGAAVWAGVDVPSGSAFLNVDALPGAAQAEGVQVAIEKADGSPVTETSTLRERPRFFSLVEGSYRLRFSRPRYNVGPLLEENHYLTYGLSTDTEDTLEAPVLAGHFSVAAVYLFCNGDKWDAQVADLASCTLASADAGTP